MKAFLFISFLIFFIATARVEGAVNFNVSQGRANLPQITLYSSITDSTGTPIPGISKDQFIVTAGDQHAAVEEVKTFDETGEGVAYIVLVDISKSIKESEFTLIKDSLISRIDGMNEKDRMAILTFGSQVRTVLDFNNEKEELKNGVNTLTPADNKTMLLAGLTRAFEMGNQAYPGLPERRIVLVLSDGKDEGSGLTVEDIIQKTAVDRIPVFSIGYSNLKPEEKRKYLDVLHRISNASGGIFLEASVSSITEMYLQIQKAITGVYRTKIVCNACKGDGKVYRVQMTLISGQIKLTDGLDMRLLPSAKKKKKGQQVAEKKDEIAIKIYGGGAAVFVLLISLLLLIRKRRKKADASPDEQQVKKDFSRPEAEHSTATSLPTNAEQKVVPVVLTVIKGRKPGEQYHHSLAESAVIGRRSECDIVVEGDPDISGHHCKVTRDKRYMLITDLNSKNGTVLNGVPAKGQQKLHDGDVITLGRTEFRVTL